MHWDAREGGENPPLPRNCKRLSLTKPVGDSEGRKTTGAKYSGKVASEAFPFRNCAQVRRPVPLRNRYVPRGNGGHYEYLSAAAARRFFPASIRRDIRR